MNKNIIVSASVLNADFMRLGEQLGGVMAAGADWVHIDVMDGCFVENISFGAPVQRCLPKNMFVDTHLMIARPQQQIDFFADSGSDIITFHLESDCDPLEVIDKIHARGLKAGVAIKPRTPAEAVLPLLGKIEMALVMTVEPGYGGQGFIPETLEKVTLIRRKAPELLIQLDGGINAQTAPLARNAGANVLVSGTYLFNAEDKQAAIKALKV